MTHASRPVDVGTLATMTHKTSVRIAMFGWLLMAAACSKDNTSTPTTPTPTPVTTPTVSENFTSTVPVGGAAFYSFNIDANGTVNVTLNSVSGPVFCHGQIGIVSHVVGVTAPSPARSHAAGARHNGRHVQSGAFCADLMSESVCLPPLRSRIVIARMRSRGGETEGLAPKILCISAPLRLRRDQWRRHGATVTSTRSAVTRCRDRTATACARVDRAADPWKWR